MAAVKFEGVKFRTFPHSNSKKRQIDKDKEDREEALEYTTDYPQLRNGGIHGGSCPDIYDDVIVYHKYESKPKKNDHHRDRKTIRKIREESEEVADGE